MNENLKQSLRATKVKSKDLNGKEFILKPNSPKLIDKANNEHVAHIYEKDTQEHLYIYSTFDDDSSAMIANEFCLNFIKSSKKVDFSYYYFSEDNKVTVYLYDMKKTFTEVDVILHLIEQWKNSIRTAQYCIDELKDYEKECEISADIYIGVITENNSVERRKETIEPILEAKKNPDRLPSFMQSKYNAENYDNIKKAEILAGFLDGKVEILKTTYKYDVREFDDKKECHISFKNGEIQ